MSGPNGALWVDPEGVIAVGRSYERHIALYDSYLTHLELLRSRYANAWGDDEIGHQFQGQFDQTMDLVVAAIHRVRASLEYAATGLRLSGEGYRQAEDDASQAGRYINAKFTTPPMRLAARLPVEEPAQEEQRPIRRLRSPAEEYEEERQLRRLRSPAEVVPPYQENAALLPTEPAIPAPGLPVASRAATPFTGTTPPVSSLLLHPTDGVLIDGVAVPQGYRLQTLNTFDDDTSRIDVNYYESVVPLGHRSVVTGPDGQPLDLGEGHLFLVRPRADAGFDPTSPDYRPLVIGFGPDGTPLPL